MYVLECELTTPASIHDTFRIFADPYNLAKITPPWLGFEIVTQDLQMRKSVEIDYRFRFLGFPLKWKTTIAAYEPPYFFTDEATSSPYKYWRHQHKFAVTPNGTLVSDRVEYDMPFGPLGRLAHAMAVRAQLKQIFEYRQRAITKLLGGEAVSAPPPKIRRLPR